MSTSTQVAVLVFCVLSYCPAFANTRVKAPQSGTKTCIEGLTEPSPDSSPSIRKLLAKYLSERVSQVPAAVLSSNIEMVQAKFDTSLIREGENLKLIRRKSMGASEWLSVDLPGRQLVSWELVGDYFVILTREDAKTHHFSLIKKSSLESSLVKTIGKATEFRTMDLPAKRGVLYVFKDGLLSIWMGGVSGGLGHEAYVTYNSFNGVIEDVEFDPNEQRYGLMRVKYVGQSEDAIFFEQNSERKRIAWAEYFNTREENYGVNNRLSILPQMIIDVPQNSQYEFVPGRSGGSKFTFLYNPPDKIEYTRVVTFDLKEPSEVEIHELGDVRVDLTKLSESDGPSRGTYLWMNTEVRYHENGKSVPSVLFLNSGAVQHSSLPFTLPKAQIVARFGRDVMIESDARRDTSKHFSSGLSWVYVYVPSGKLERSFLMRSSLQLKDFTTEPPVPVRNAEDGKPSGIAVGGRQPFLFARAVHSERPGVFIINRLTADVVWFPNLEEIVVFSVGKVSKIVFRGHETRNGMMVPLLSIYDGNKKSWRLVDDQNTKLIRDERLVEPSDLEDKPGEYGNGFSFLNGSDNVLVAIRAGQTLDQNVASNFYKPHALDGWAKPDSVRVSYSPQWESMQVDLVHPRFGPLTNLFGLSTDKDGQYGRVFPVDVTYEGGLQAKEFSVLASEHYKASGGQADDGYEFDSGESIGSSGGDRSEKTFLSIVRRGKGGAIESYRTSVKGRVRRLRMVKAGDDIFAIGEAELSGLGNRPVISEFRWNIRKEDPTNVLFNKLAKPIYKDAEIEVIASLRSRESEPRIIVYQKGQIIGNEIALSYEFNEDKRDTVLFDFFSFLFGGSKDITRQVNKQDIESVKRDKDLLFVSTKAPSGQSSMTYVYSLEMKEILCAIPNYQTYVDVGVLRFFIGESGFDQPTIVAVFNHATNRFLTFFNFGQVALDSHSRESVRIDGSKILFKTRNNSRRVYDTHFNHFSGTLPKDIEDLVKPLEGLGTIWNNPIFQTDIPGFFEREDFMKTLMQAFPLRRSKHGPNFGLLIGESGAGTTEALRNYVSRYITGDFTPEPTLRGVFLFLDSLSMTSDTMYRGTKADKYKKVREVARSLSESGYRLIVIADHVERFLPDGQFKQADEEGDFFSIFTNLMESGEFDFIGTTTPNGALQLQRMQSAFYNKMSRFVRMPPLSDSATLRAVNSMIEDEGYPKATISDSQIGKVIYRVGRLNSRRVQPGVTMDVVKKVLAERIGKNQVVESASPRPKRSRVKTPVSTSISDQELNRVIAGQTGVPEVFLDQDLAGVAQRMKAYLKSKVKGVDDIIDQLVHDLLAMPLDVGRSDWPVVRILARGPTGTGKTALIKAVSEFLMDVPEARLLLSGEDYKGPSTDKLKRLISDHVKKYPFNIIHIDEVDKMDSENLDILLSLSDGEIADGRGEKQYTNLSILWLTTNLGSHEVSLSLSRKKPGFVSYNPAVWDDEGSEILDKEMHEKMRPETFNRIDRVLTFPYLKKDVARVLLEDYLNGLEGTKIEPIRMRYSKKGMKIRFGESVIGYALDAYLDPMLGGRRLAINIENGVVRGFLVRQELEGNLERARSEEVTVEYSIDRGGFYLDYEKDRAAGR